MILFLLLQEFEYENNDEDNEDEDNVNEMCENLYMSAAKCNQNFDTVNEDAYYVSSKGVPWKVLVFASLHICCL
jgi:hypothetical protein